MMGPLSVKAQVQANAGRVKDQMTVIKTLSDEARKKDLHKLKMAKEIAKAKAEGIPIDESAIGFADGKLAIPRPGSQQPDTTLKSNSKGVPQENTGIVVPKPGQDGPSVTLKNPEAGPSDTIPAMLTPGEAVIPASVAQDSAYKPVIEALVNEGRMRNRQPGGVKGYADGVYEAGNRDSFMDYYGPYAEEAAKKLGVDKSIILTQLGHETGWGKKTVGTNNLGNIKDFANQEGSVQARDKIEGSNDKYRSYDSPKAFFDDYTSLLERRFPGVKGSGSDLQKFVAGLTNEQGQKYATDPDYGKKLEAIMASKKGESGGGRGTVIPPTGAEIAAMQRGIPMSPAELMQAQATRYGNTIKAKSPEMSPEQRANAASQVRRLDNEIIATAKARANPQPSGSVVPPVVPSTVQQPQEVPKPATPITPVISPDDRDPAEIRRTQEYQDQLTKVMEDANVQKELAVAQQTPPPPGVEPKDWLSQQFAKIFGKTGMFNEEDLIRFSLLAAGGLLTGGSIGGSIRYAGLHTLKASDERRGTEAAVAARQQQAQAAHQFQLSQAQAAHQFQLNKDQLDRNQKMEDEFHKYAAKADPAVKDQATKLFAEAADPKMHPAMKEAKLRAAITLLSNNQVDEKKSGTVLSGYDSKTGKLYEYYFDKNNKKIGIDTKTGQQFDPAAKGINIIDDKAMNDIQRRQDQAITDELAGHLARMNTDKSTKKPIVEKYDPKLHAAELTATFGRLREYLGYDADPKAMSKVVSNAIANMKEDFSGVKILDLTPDALAKVVMGSTIIDSRKVNKPLYKASGNESGRLGPEATQMMTELFEQVKSRGGNVDVALDDMEAKYKALPRDIQEKFENAAKVQPGWSPFLLWMKAPKTTK